MKPTEILLDLNDLKLGRIVKKDFEEVIVDISAKTLESGPAPAPRKGLETKGAETLPIAPAPFKGVETAPKAAETKFEPTVYK